MIHINLQIPSDESPMSTQRSQLWQRIRQARKYADLTQQQLADACGVTRGAVALWEAAEPEHRAKPITDNLVAISKTTNVPLEWLLNDYADVDAIWRLNGEFGQGATPLPVLSSQSIAAPAPVVSRDPPADVLPDLQRGEHLFVFASTPEQIALKVAQLGNLPEGVKGHLVLIGTNAEVHTAIDPAQALSSVFDYWSKLP